MITSKNKLTLKEVLQMAIEKEINLNVNSNIGGSIAELKSLKRELKGHSDLTSYSFEELIAVADSEGHLEISNYAQDQVLDLAKSIWMLSATLD